MDQHPISSIESLSGYVTELLPAIEKREAVSSREDQSSLSLLQLLEKKRVKGMLAFKGLPFTGKTQLAAEVAKWANCPALCIQHFLGDGKEFQDLNLSYDDLSPLNRTKAVEIHFQKAFANLMSVTSFHLIREVSHCVSIKSGFDTEYELQLLANTLSGCYRWGDTLVIIECTVRNKYWWKKRFEDRSRMGTWSSPRSWIDIEKAVDDSAAQPPQCWQYLPQLARASTFTIIRLQVDPHFNLSVNIDDDFWGYRFPDEFGDAIKYLLTLNQQVGLNPKHVYVVEYDELQRFLFDKKIRDAASKGRTDSICQRDCVFKYWPEAIEDPVAAGFCRICKEIISGPAYTCHFCIASLHKSCAEKIDVAALQYMSPFMNDFIWFVLSVAGERICEDCNGGGTDISSECSSCLEHRFRHLGVPYIMNHNYHNHFLSRQLINLVSTCKACGGVCIYPGNYGCKRCAVYYHSGCAFMPLELKNEHGGHTHIMNLKCSRDGMEEEEECWCDFCYEDMDPEHWFYSCSKCPHYAFHLNCIDDHMTNFFNPRMIKFVDQIQSQFQDWLDQGNIPELFIFEMEDLLWSESSL